MRRYLLADAEDFRDLCAATPTMFAELSKQVDQLVGGEAVRAYWRARMHKELMKALGG